MRYYENSTQARYQMESMERIFKSGEAPELLAKVALVSPALPSSLWTVANRLLCYDANKCLDNRPFRNWRKVQRNVIRGAKATWILKPKFQVTINPNTQRKGVEICGFNALPVFPFTQTEGALINIGKRPSLPSTNKLLEILDADEDDGSPFHTLARACFELAFSSLPEYQGHEIALFLVACTIARLYSEHLPDEKCMYDMISSYAEEMGKPIPITILGILHHAQKMLDRLAERLRGHAEALEGIGQPSLQKEAELMTS